MKEKYTLKLTDFYIYSHIKSELFFQFLQVYIDCSSSIEKSPY